MDTSRDQAPGRIDPESQSGRAESDGVRHVAQAGQRRYWEAGPVGLGARQAVSSPETARLAPVERTYNDLLARLRRTSPASAESLERALAAKVQSPFMLVVNYCAKDVRAAQEVLAWMAELDGQQDWDVMLAFDQGVPPGDNQKVVELAKAAFTRVRLFSYPPPDDPAWPSGPNHCWQTVARYICDFGDLLGRPSWLWFEPDAVPLVPKWLHALAEAYKAGGRPFMGHMVAGRDHFNGTAIYPWNVSFYSTAPLMVQWQPWDVVMGQDMAQSGNMGYFHDCGRLIETIWTMEETGATSEDGRRPDWEPPSFKSAAAVEKAIWPEAVLFHRCKDGSLIKWLRLRKSEREAAAKKAK